MTDTPTADHPAADHPAADHPAAGTPAPGAHVPGAQVPGAQVPGARRATRAERLDRLPLTREHRKLVVGSGLGWALDAMDVGLISFVMAALSVQWGLSSGELSWVASVGFIGMALGASLGGLLADRIGRRQVFALTLLVYGLATGASALVGSVGALMALRFVVGLGLGAELPVASTLVSEFAPARIRGRIVVVLEAFWAVGWLLAALIGYFVVPASESGWRWALVLGALPAVYAVVVRRGLPESVRFLERAGRGDEAEVVVQRFEAAAASSVEVGGGGRTTRTPPRDVAVTDDGAVIADAGGTGDSGETGDGGEGGDPAMSGDPQAPMAAVPRPGALWAAGLRARTAALWSVWFFVNFSYYGAFIWLPTILVADGYSLVRSFGFTLVITLAQLPGYAVAAILIEKWGRRPTLATFLLGSAAAAGLFGFAGGETSILVAGMLLSFFNLGAWGALYAVTPEIYPTALRGTGAGWAAGFGRIASILAPLAVPPMLDVGGNELAFAVFGVAFLIASGAALTLPERRGLALEE